MTQLNTVQSVAPPTAAEAAAVAASWERRGFLGRLVRISEEVEVSAEESQRSARRSRRSVVPATRSF
jgi:hypothetical protein